MKRYLLIFAMLFAASCLWGQNKSDQTAVLQKCINLPNVSKHYKSDPTGVPISLDVVQGSVTIPSDLAVSYFGRKIVFTTLSDIVTTKADSFFSFTRFDVNQSSASVEFDFNYNYNSGKNVIHLTLELQNVAGEWKISSTKETTR
jgi:hypothetical protein